MSPSKSHRDDYQRQVVSTPDVRMVPVAITACGMAVVGIGGHRWMILSAGIGCLAAGMIAVKRKAWLVVVSAAVGLTVLMSAGMRDLVVHHTGVAELAQEGAAVTVTGRVAADPRIFEVNGSGGSTVMITLVAHRIVAEAQAIDQSVRIVAMASGSTSGPATTVVVGQQVQVRGLLTPPREGRAEAAVLKLRAPPRVVAPPGPLDRGVNRFRAGLVSAVAGCPEGQRAIVPSLVVGDTAAVSEEMSEEFRVTALTHLMAVSGANLASTTALLWWIGAWCGLKRRGLRATSVAGVVVFVVACRAEASVVRAAAMGVVAMAATGVAFDRRGGIRTLAVAVTGLMLIDPWLVGSVGFWLSVCATAGILWWAQPWSVAMEMGTSLASGRRHSAMGSPGDDSARHHLDGWHRIDYRPRRQPRGRPLCTTSLDTRDGDRASRLHLAASGDAVRAACRVVCPTDYLDSSLWCQGAIWSDQVASRRMGSWGAGRAMYGIGLDYSNGLGEALVDCACRTSSHSSDGRASSPPRLAGTVAGGDL